MPSKRRIVIPTKHSFYCALAKGTDSRQGLAPSLVLFDEIHALGAKSELWQILQSKLSKRKNPLWIGVTTAGIADPNHLAYQEFLLAKRIADGEIKHPHYLPILYYAEKDEDWTDEKVWQRVNPALGDFKNIDAVREEFAIAKRIAPAGKTTSVANILICLSIKPPAGSIWTYGTTTPTRSMRNRLEGCECWAGLDLAPVRDLSSLSLLFRQGDTFKVLNYNWCCEEDILDRSRRDGVPYDQWARSGVLRTTPGGSTDFDVVRRDIVELSKKYKIKILACDQVHAYQLGQQLSEQDGLTVQWHRQGFLSMGPPTARLEKLLLDRKLHHGGNVALRFAAGNMTVETDAVNNIKPSKAKSVERIDPIVSLIMSIGAMLSEPEKPQRSVYEERGMVILG